MQDEQTRIQQALDKIYECGGVDGDHHKQWLLDQVVRILTGTPEAYQKWLAEFAEGEDGPHTYQWDIGIVP